ncbi:MAG: hypothetical protein JJ892_12100 [Balneola sp.]|nr:hypothetical protein [Balneola sp.]MBO6651467.1 hypothetical protein [Balneola sp.]MBO6712496.1 hypothetical protein [Balneola sp.]MBO6801011.1 hypothetical protein [Balneola sp.]MBO6870683.1 hypothetical protein [Balneola sp.]
MTRTVENKVYNFIGNLSIALYSQGIQISLDALKQILNDHGQNYSESSNRGLGKVVSSAYDAWKEIDPVVHHAIAWTFIDKGGKPAWEKRV